MIGERRSRGQALPALGARRDALECAASWDQQIVIFLHQNERKTLKVRGLVFYFALGEFYYVIIPSCFSVHARSRRHAN